MARELLLDVGFESFTCEEVASRAGLPIGTLYQFFQNKYVIVCELDRVDAVAVRLEASSFSEAIPSLDWLRFLDRLVDHMAALWANDPSRRAVWLAVQSTPATRATAAVTERELAAEVAPVPGTADPRHPTRAAHDHGRGAGAHRLLDAELLDPRRPGACRVDHRSRSGS
ncbi:TetR family transcriptional regulator [Aeromicrobium sp. UC242_57]|uniref:TetR family transcriptional regulator n=1 Tax=Aeromicrobium sp. UC242_57 TaxID=3374624 RepID=UPI0037A94BC9